MLECNSMRRVTVIAVLMLICAGCAHASFGKCYRNCYEKCEAASKELTSCITKCIFKCIGKSTNSCNVQCAADRCSRFGNYADKVEDCVNKCDSNSCTAY
ncbi:hypothetical protein SASPL_115794 [Salvia splendens]|uniref:Uncharacterized protein n=1 Tax=Salvia splendens TaxID=180675 RepID=A0A8X8Y646_SALSN|nr:hypothetical protein SASPL_115794 [Salvia splendens]